MFTNFIKKFKIEMSILYDNIKYIIFYIFVLVYIASTLGRNLAYYRSIQDTRLKDLGFDLIPELPNNIKFISEIIIGTNTFIGLLIVFAPLWFFPSNNFYSSILIGKRIISVLGIGHLIRFIMYISTSLPSPAIHCLQSSTYNPPTDLISVFFRFSSFNDLNCGDLIFSGHMLQSISFTILTFFYAPRIFNFNFANTISIIQLILTILQVYFIIASRNHYTIDIIVAIYVTLTLWYINLLNYPIDDEIKIFISKLEISTRVDEISNV